MSRPTKIPPADNGATWDTVTWPTKDQTNADLVAAVVAANKGAAFRLVTGFDRYGVAVHPAPTAPKPEKTSDPAPAKTSARSGGKTKEG